MILTGVLFAFEIKSKVSRIFPEICRGVQYYESYQRQIYIGGITLSILNIDKATSGLVEISGQDISKMTKDSLALFRRKHLGFVFQDFNLLDSLSLRENIMLPMILDDKDPDEVEVRISSLSERLDINEILDKYSYTVSGGQQQRAAICRAIANNPDIIFADEPTGNLDSKSSKNVMKHF